MKFHIGYSYVMDEGFTDTPLDDNLTRVLNLFSLTFFLFFNCFCFLTHHTLYDGISFYFLPESNTLRPDVTNMTLLHSSSLISLTLQHRPRGIYLATLQRNVVRSVSLFLTTIHLRLCYLVNFFLTITE